MFEINADNAIAYLRSSGRLTGDATVEVLSGGVSNVVLRIETAGDLFVLKQSRPQLRTRDAWFSDLDRVYREQEVMEALHPLLPPLTAPRVLFADRENFLFAMSHAPRDSRVWKGELLAGRVDADLAASVGCILGRMHEATAQRREIFERFSDSTVFQQLRIDPFYRRVQERLPDVSRPIGDLIEQMLTRREALCHGDYTPKNMLIHAQGFTLVDYETAYFGDPAMDLGLCLAHLVLKCFHLPEKREDFTEAIRGFWRGYLEESTQLSRQDIEPRGLAHLGACLLARIDGTSPVDYLAAPPRREAVRAFARRLLFDCPRSWREVEPRL